MRMMRMFERGSVGVGYGVGSRGEMVVRVQ